MADNPYTNIVAGTTTGSDSAALLNLVGLGETNSIKTISAIADVASEVGHYVTGSRIYAINEDAYYKWNGTAWVVDTVLPTGTEVSDVATDLSNHIGDTDNPHSVTASQVGSPALVNPSVVNNLVAFSSTDGLQKDSGKKLTDLLQKDGSVTADYIPLLKTVVRPTYAEGILYWDSAEKTLALMTELSDVTIQVGQEQIIRVVNKTGSLITDGSAVYISGAQGNRPTITLASSSSETAAKVIGVATADIPDNDEGYVTTEGVVRGYNTSTFNAGDKLYLSTVAGQLTKTKGASPLHSVCVAVALNSTNNGSIFVKPEPDFQFDDLHDVVISNPTNMQIIKYNQSTGYWENHTLTASDISALPTSGGTISGNLSITGTLSVNGVSTLNGQKNAITTVTGNTTLNTTHSTVVVNSATDPVTISLPTAVGIGGREYTIKTIENGVVTIDPNGAETIDGATTIVFSQPYQSVTIKSNGANWLIIGGYKI